MIKRDRHGFMIVTEATADGELKLMIRDALRRPKRVKTQGEDDAQRRRRLARKLFEMRRGRTRVIDHGAIVGHWGGAGHAGGGVPSALWPGCGGSCEAARVMFSAPVRSSWSDR